MLLVLFKVLDLYFYLNAYGLVIDPGLAFRILFIFSLTVGTMFVMWLGEQISLFGIGNGASMIIFAGIVARFPDDIIKVLGAIQEGYLDPVVDDYLYLLSLLLLQHAIVFLEKGERKIPVQYSRRVVGQQSVWWPKYIYSI